MFEQIVARLTRMVKLDFTVFPEIEQDEAATTEAAVIVLVTSLIGALGLIGAGFWRFLLQFVISVGVGWLLWSYITLIVGTRLFGGSATFWGMARTLGYASAPGILRLLGFIPIIGWLFSLAAWVLSLILGFYAVRETLELTTEKALLTVIIGWVVMVVISVPISLIL